jgi:hypothetical protein
VNHNAVNLNILINCNNNNNRKAKFAEKAHEPALFLCSVDESPPCFAIRYRLVGKSTLLTVDCRGVNISLTKPIWKLSNDKSVRYFVKTTMAEKGHDCKHSPFFFTITLVFFLPNYTRHFFSSELHATFFSMQ